MVFSALHFAVNYARLQQTATKAQDSTKPNSAVRNSGMA